jgi:Prion-inhibition and propagation
VYRERYRAPLKYTSMDPISFAISVVSIASLFSTCLDAYKIFLDVADFQKVGSHIQWRLKKEQIRLIVWGRNWGLLSDQEDWKDPKMKGLLEQHLNNQGIADFVVETLARLTDMFLDAQQVGSRYGLVAKEPDDKNTVCLL